MGRSAQVGHARQWRQAIFREEVVRRLPDFGLLLQADLPCDPDGPSLQADRVSNCSDTEGHTVYPDTWIRNLPLEIGECAQVPNRATLGTNMCLHDGTILVDEVRIGEGALIGHLSMIAPGAVIGDHAEVGVGTPSCLRYRRERASWHVELHRSTGTRHNARIWPARRNSRSLHAHRRTRRRCQHQACVLPVCESS